jgi:hypothetical protein
MSPRRPKNKYCFDMRVLAEPIVSRLTTRPIGDRILDGDQAPLWWRRLTITLAAATAMLVGELDASLRFADSLLDQVHRSGTMATFVGGRFP